MTEPSQETLFEALDTTWPAVRQLQVGNWILREGLGGGQRVSAATATKPVSTLDVDEAEKGMRGLSQRPLFMVRPGEDALDEMLADRGYEIVDPVVIYVSPIEEIAEKPAPVEGIAVWPPLAVQTEIWAEAGIGPARTAVMERARCPRTSILARVKDRPAATVYVGASNGVAMLHALETRPRFRRHGAGARLVRAAAEWGRLQDARYLSLAVVDANVPANALYRKLGMIVATRYHYRRAPEGRP